MHSISNTKHMIYTPNTHTMFFEDFSETHFYTVKTILSTNPKPTNHRLLFSHKKKQTKKTMIHELFSLCDPKKSPQGPGFWNLPSLCVGFTITIYYLPSLKVILVMNFQ